MFRLLAVEYSNNGVGYEQVLLFISSYSIFMNKKRKIFLFYSMYSPLLKPFLARSA